MVVWRGFRQKNASPTSPTRIRQTGLVDGIPCEPPAAWRAGLIDRKANALSAAELIRDFSQELSGIRNRRRHRFRSCSGGDCESLPHITLICGGEERISIEESLLPRASTVHNNK